MCLYKNFQQQPPYQACASPEQQQPPVHCPPTNTSHCPPMPPAALTGLYIEEQNHNLKNM